MARGFTLAEVLTAMGLLTVSALATAQLFAATAAALHGARMQTAAAALAAARIEMLRVDPAIQLSSPDTLDRDVEGFVDFLDANGDPAAAGGAVFVRRWSVEPAADSADVLVIQVLVRAPRARARLVTLRRR